jgi:hypothetical protein
MATTAKKRGKRSTAKSRRTTIAAKAPASAFQPGDIVMFHSEDPPGIVGPGRVCSLLGFNQACVMFGDGLGCRRVGTNFLRAAPPGSEAPQCDLCTDC